MKINKFEEKLYNIYYGTIGKTLGVRYRFSKYFRSEKQAREFAESSAESFYYKNEGKFGLPSYTDILKESQITGLNMQTLTKDHINDMMRWYAIPSEVDSISYKKLKY